MFDRLQRPHQEIEDDDDGQDRVMHKDKIEHFGGDVEAVMHNGMDCDNNADDVGDIHGDAWLETHADCK